MLANKVQIFTGENLSSTLLGIIRPVLDAGAFYVSANAGPSQLAGKGCQPHFFSFSFQNDTLYEAVGYLANEEKVPTMYLVGSNYPAGRDMLAGFKRHYKGQVVGEAYTPARSARLCQRDRRHPRQEARRGGAVRCGQ